MLINGTLYNAEIWHNLLKREIEELENVDKIFIRKLQGVPKSTPIEAFYLEFGA